MMRSHFVIAEFETSDQPGVRALLEASMRDRWATFDPSANADLIDIAASFRDGVMLVAKDGSTILGCGGLVRENEDTARVVRMSVAKKHRRQGIATALLQRLMGYAAENGYATLVLETTASWSDDVAFYERRGFVAVQEEGGDRHFEKRIA